MFPFLFVHVCCPFSVAGDPSQDNPNSFPPAKYHQEKAIPTNTVPGPLPRPMPAALPVAGSRLAEPRGLPLCVPKSPTTREGWGCAGSSSDTQRDWPGTHELDSWPPARSRTQSGCPGSGAGAARANCPARCRARVSTLPGAVLVHSVHQKRQKTTGVHDNKGDLYWGSTEVKY